MDYITNIYKKIDNKFIKERKKKKSFLYLEFLLKKIKNNRNVVYTK